MDRTLMKLGELAGKIGGRLEGDGQRPIERIASLQDAGPREISFLSDTRFADQVSQTKAGAVIVPRDFQGSAPTALIFVDDVDEAVECLLDWYAPEPDVPAAGVHPRAWVEATARLDPEVAVGAGAVVGPEAQIGTGTVISAGCIIGRGVRIGEHCLLYPNVVIFRDCRVGDRVIIHANSTIGADGFGYRLVEGRHRKIPHIGIVEIEDEVEIGVSCCVDRAKFGRTVIGRGTKIDNLVQIGHNVQIGEHCIVVAQTGIAGSTELGRYVILSGQCGISDHVTVGDGVMMGPKTGVASYSHVEAGTKIIGMPFQTFRRYYRQVSLIHKLPELARQIKDMQKKIDQGAETDDHR